MRYDRLTNVGRRLRRGGVSGAGVIEVHDGDQGGRGPHPVAYSDGLFIILREPGLIMIGRKGT